MIVYVESNFVLELAFLREEHLTCAELLALAEARSIQLVIPAFSIGEPYEAWVRRSKQRSDLHGRLSSEIKELSRSEPYKELSHEFHELTGLLVRSNEDEKQRLDEALDRILHVAQISPITASTIRLAIDFQRNRSLKPQDSIVYASVIQHLSESPSAKKCFITANSKDFVNPDIKNELASQACSLLTRFSDGLGYILSQS
jgi:predicted nucleic acid-binding protein